MGKLENLRGRSDALESCKHRKNWNPSKCYYSFKAILHSFKLKKYQMRFILHDNNRFYFEFFDSVDSLLSQLLYYTMFDDCLSKNKLKGIELWIDFSGETYKSDYNKYYRSYYYIGECAFYIQDGKLEINPQDDSDDETSSGNYLDFARIGSIKLNFQIPSFYNNDNYDPDSNSFLIEFETCFSNCYFVWEVLRYIKGHPDFDEIDYYEYDIKRLSYYRRSNDYNKAVFGPASYEDCVQYTITNKPKVNKSNCVEVYEKNFEEWERIKEEFIKEESGSEDYLSDSEIFNSLTDGQLGTYDEFGGDIGDAKRQLGLD